MISPSHCLDLISAGTHSGYGRIGDPCLSLTGTRVDILTVKSDLAVLEIDQVLDILLGIVITSVKRIEENDRRLWRDAGLGRTDLDIDSDLLGNDVDAPGYVIPVINGNEDIVDSRLVDDILLLHLIFRIVIDEMDHDVCELRIELGTGTLHQFLTNGLLGNGITVASSRRHGVVCIGYGNDAGDLRNIGSLEAVRITPAVVTLVMVMGTDAEVRIYGDVIEDLRAHCGMVLDDGILLVVQPALFVDDLFRNTDLAYVMKERDIVYLLALFGTLACKRGDLLRILGNSCGVTVSILVLCIDRVYESRGGLCEETFDVLMLFLVS